MEGEPFCWLCRPGEVPVPGANEKTKAQKGSIQQIKLQLQEENKRLSKARELLLCGDIDAEDYRIMKSEMRPGLTGYSGDVDPLDFRFRNDRCLTKLHFSS